MTENIENTELTKTRSFGGKIDNFKDNQERSFEKKHLKAYLKGFNKFRNGRTIEGYPNYTPVKEIWT